MKRGFSIAPKKVLLLMMIIGLIAFLAACSSPPEDVGTNNNGQSSGEQTGNSQVEWSADMDCAICHASEQDSYGDSACEASLHQDLTCIQCHDASMETVHEGVTATSELPKRLKNTEVSDDHCLSCHYQTREALIEATNGKTIMTDSKGTQQNPHDSGGIKEHEALRCQDCHGMHDAKPVEEQAMNTCVACHHDGVFECYTCHE